MRPELWEQVKTAFDEISDSGPQERQSVLETLSGEARAEVERMLASYDQSRHGESTANQLFPEFSVVAALIRDSRTFEVGQLLNNRFEIRRVLGCGGMGEVYAAWDQRLGDVALKTLRLELSTLPSTLEAFRREVTRGRKVSHPNVCRIYDLFETDNTDSPVPFFTMQLLTGETLSSLLATNGPISSDRAQRLALQLCDGLEAAHEAGVIHGDFKCANIIVEPEPGGGERAKITDFGLAQLAPWLEAQEPASAAPVAGTKAYLALEVLNGSPPSVASDVFALGVVLLQMKAGQYWFDSEADWEATKVGRRNPPSIADLTTRMTVPWATAISRCLAADPAARPPSAGAVRGILLDSPHPPSLQRRHVLFAFAVLAAGSIMGGTWFASKRTVSPGLPAGRLKALVGEFEVSGSPPATARAVRNLFSVALAASKRLEVVKEGEIHSVLETSGLGAQKLRGGIAKSVAAKTGARVLVEGSIRSDHGDYVLSVEAFDPLSGNALLPLHTRRVRATDLPRVVADVCGALRERLGGDILPAQFAAAIPEQADTSNSDALESFTLGVSFYQNGDREAALAKLEEATRLDAQFAMAFAYQALVHYTFGREDLALGPSIRAYELRQKLNAHHRLYTEFLHLWLLGDHEAATQQVQTLVQLFPNDPTLNRNLSQLFALNGKPEAGLEFARKSAEVDPENPMNQVQYAAALAETGHGGDADRTIESALSRSPGSPALLFCQAYLALLKLDHAAATAIAQTIVRRGRPAPLAKELMIKALILGGDFARARAEIEGEISLMQLRSDVSGLETYRYWLGQISAIRGDKSAAAEQAKLLCEREPTPGALNAYRVAAELSWVADRPDLLKSLTVQMRKAQQVHTSTRSLGFLNYVEALAHSSLGRAPEAVDRMSKAMQYWPDIATQWALGELLLESQNHQGALACFEAVVNARRSALRFTAVALWVRSLARAALCLERRGMPAGAAYRAQFKQLWGEPGQYWFARVSNVIRLANLDRLV